MNYLLHPSSCSPSAWQQQSPPNDNHVAQRILNASSINEAKHLFNQCGLQALAGLPNACNVQLYAHRSVQTLELFYITPGEQRCQQVWLSNVQKQFCERELAWDSWLDDYGPRTVRIDNPRAGRSSSSSSVATHVCPACRKPFSAQE